MTKKLSYEELEKAHERLKGFAKKRYTFCDGCEEILKGDRIDVKLNNRLIGKYHKNCYPHDNNTLEMMKAVEESDDE